MPFGILTLVQGSLITIPAGTFEIIEGCAGKRHLLLAISLAAVSAPMLRLGVRRGTALILISVMLALVVNWIRIVVVIVAGHLTNMQNYLVAVEHRSFGYVLLALLAVAIVAIAVRLSRLPVTLHEPAEATTGAPTGVATSHPIGGLLGAIVLLGVGSAATTWEAARPIPASRLGPLSEAIPGWRGPFAPNRAWRPHFAGAADEQQAAYRRGDIEVTLYANVYARQTDTAKLIYYGNSLFAPGAWRQRDLVSAATPDGVGGGGFEPRMVRGTDPSGRLWAVLYEYDVGRFHTTSDVAAQLLYGLLAYVGDPSAGVVSGCSAVWARTAVTPGGLRPSFGGRRRAARAAWGRPRRERGLASRLMRYIDSPTRRDDDSRFSGAIAQLGERLHGMQEVVGSIPTSSTNFRTVFAWSPSSRGLGHHPFKVATRVRIPLGTPFASHYVPGSRRCRAATLWAREFRGGAPDGELRSSVRIVRGKSGKLQFTDFIGCAAGNGPRSRQTYSALCGPGASAGRVF